jgi:hypothetical protein
VLCAFIPSDQDVAWSQVTMEESTSVRMLHGIARLSKESRPLREPRAARIACDGDRPTIHELHDEVRAPSWRDPAVDGLGDRWVIESRQRLPFLVESSDDRFGIHARFEDLDRHDLPEGLVPRGLPDGSRSALAHHLLEREGAHAFTRRLAVR